MAGARQEELESFVSASSQREREGLVTESSHIRYCGRRSRSHERNLSLKPEVEKGLRARAHARGVSLDDYLQELVTKEAGLTVAAEPRPIQKRFDNLSDLLLNSPFAGANLDLERPKDYPRPVDLA